MARNVIELGSGTEPPITFTWPDNLDAAGYTTLIFTAVREGDKTEIRALGDTPITAGVNQAYSFAPDISAMVLNKLHRLLIVTDTVSLVHVDICPNGLTDDPFYIKRVNKGGDV